MALSAAEATEVRLATAAMGTRFELVLLGADRNQLLAAGEAAVEAIDGAHRTLTRFESSSLLAHIQRVSPQWVFLDGPTFRLFETVDDLVAASRGAFDPTRAGRWLEVRLDRDGSRVALRSKVELDFGAIAKGHAVDLAIQVLRDHGVESAFVHGGTSSGFGLGTTPNGAGWGVRLGRDGPTVRLTNQAYGLSAAWQLADGTPKPHLVDPRTGEAITWPRRVAVVGPTACLADGWSTAGLVLGGRPPALPTDWRFWVAQPGPGWGEQ